MTPTVIARLACEETTARLLCDHIAETVPDVAVVACEGPRSWVVELHFATPPDATAVRAAVAQIAPAIAHDLVLEPLAARDWVAESLAGLTPVAAGRVVVHGAHDRHRIAANALGIEIEASLAFGTGHHGTTRGCLLALDGLAKAWRRRGASRRGLDVGTGTGVLAIAAEKRLGLAMIGNDIDPQAVRVATGNMRVNGARARIVAAGSVRNRAVAIQAPFDLVFANILLSPLRRMASELVAAMAPGAPIVLSGLLASQATAAVAAYRARGLVLERRITLEGWTTLIMRRPRTQGCRRDKTA